MIEGDLGDTLENPNVFTVPADSDEKLCVDSIVEEFPFGPNFSFWFRSGSPSVWVLPGHSDVVPKAEGRIFLKVYIWNHYTL